MGRGSGAPLGLPPVLERAARRRRRAARDQSRRARIRDARHSTGRSTSDLPESAPPFLKHRRNGLRSGQHSAMNYFANIISGPNAGQRRPLTNHAILVVGRGDDCDLRLSDPSVSRIHARITLVDGHVYLEDAGSRWGTLVNNKPTESRELFPGDCVAIGDTQLRLELESPLVTTISPIHKRILRTLSGRARGRRNGVKKAPSPDREDDPESTLNQPRRAVARKPLDVAALVGKKFLRYRVE